MQLKGIAIPNMEGKNTDQKIMGLYEAFIELQKQVNYVLQNLGADNFNQQELVQIAASAGGANRTVSDEEYMTRFKQTLRQITMLASRQSAVYVEDTAPAGTQDAPLKKGDIWFNSADGYMLHTWNGVLWERGVTGGVLASFIDIRDGIIKVFSGGSVDFQTNNFLVKNAAGYNMLSVTNEDSATGEQGGRIKLGEPDNPVALDDTFVLPVQNGGTGRSTGEIYRLTAPPASTLGVDGDIAVVYNGAAGERQDVVPILGGETSAPRFGFQRAWNSVSLAGHVNVGNLGAVGTLYGAFWGFQIPEAAASALTLEMVIGKYVGGTWYGWNNNLPLTVAVYGTLLGDPRGTATFVPGNNMGAVSVPLTLNPPLDPDTLYYIAVFDTSGSANKSRAIVRLDSVLLPGGTGGNVEGGYYKSRGQWVPFSSGDALEAHISDTDNPHEVTAAQAGAEPAGTASAAVSAHNGSGSAHGSLFGEKQNKITATGMLKGSGDGSVTAAVGNTDYQRPIVYSTSQPSGPYAGMIWLKPKA